MSDLSEAVKVAPAGRDVRRILLKAIEETEIAHREKGEQEQSTDNSSPKQTPETSSDTINDCSSSGVGSSVASTSERG